MTLKTENVHKSLDFVNQGILRNWGLQVLTSDPATTYARIYYNSTSNKVRVYNTGTPGWEDLGATVGVDNTTIEYSGANLQVKDNGISNTKLADMANLRVKGNVSGSTGDPTDLTPAQVTTNFVVPDNTTVEVVTNAVQLKDNGVSNTKLTDMAQSTIKGRASGAGTGDPTDLTGAQVKTILAIVPADVSGFDTQVRTSRLDQMAAPTAAVSMNSQRITNLADPTSAQDAATKAYVDATAAGIDWKASVRAATTANIATLAGGAPNTLDGVTLAANDRILVKNQSTGSQNGIYTVQTLGTGANGTWVRATDADTSAEVTAGVATFVEQGTVNGDTGWVLTTDNPITLGTTALVFTQFTSLGQVTAGTGLTQSGSTINAVAGSTPGSGGPGGGLVANADDLVIDTNIVSRRFAANLGDGSTADLVVTHNLGTRDVEVTVINAASPFDKQETYWEATTTNTVTIFFPTAPASNAYRVIVRS